MVEISTTKCALHKDRDAIGTCAFCGDGYCLYCRSIVEGKSACSACAAKWYGISPIGTNLGSANAPALARTTDNASRTASAVLLFLFSATYVPLLVHLDKSRSIFIGVLVLAVISLVFQAALIVRNSLWVWWICLVLWIADMAVMNILFFDSLDPTGAFSLVILIFFFPIAISILVWINYRSKEIVSAALAITAVLSIIIYTFVHNALINS